jgi:carbon-monoxide dehydrogenase medium subunit
LKASSADGSRVIPLDDFFTDYYETVLKPDEIVTEVFIPKMAPNSAGAYLKFLPRTADDYATVSAAAVLTMDKSRKIISDVRIALGSVGVTPIRATAAENVLRGQPVKAEAFAEAGEKAKEAVDPVSDFRGSAAYKKEMAGVFVRRALEKAWATVRQQARAKPALKAVKKAIKKGKRR